MQHEIENNVIDFGIQDSLTDWANEPSLRELKQNFTDAQSSHIAHRDKVYTWLQNMEARPVNRGEGKSKIVPKLIRKQAEWRYAALSEPFLGTEDIFNIYPVTFEDKKGSYQNELILNNQFNTKLDKNKFIDEYIRTAVDEGTVIVRVGWEYQDEVQQVEEEFVEFKVNPELAPVHAQIHQLMQQDLERFQNEVPPEMQQAHQMSMQTGQPIEPVVSTRVIEKTVILKNQPTLEVCNYRNIIIDPTCQGDLSKAKFIIFSFETSLSELKKDGRYTNLDNINIESNSILGDPDHSNPDDSSFNFSDKARKKFVAYEYHGYWDIHNTGMVESFISTWVGDTKIRMEESPFPDKKLPFVGVQYLPVRRSVYGEPDGALLEDNQAITGAVTRGMIDILARSANGQIGTSKDFLDITNKRKFNRGMDYEFNATKDPRTSVYTHVYPEIPQSAQYMLDFQNREAESLTGVKAFYEGISGKNLGDTATGVRGALDAASKRELGILRRLADGIVSIGRKIVSMNQEFLSEEEVVRITNEEFVPIKKDDLSGNFDFRLKISTIEEDHNKAQELAFMLQTIGNTMPPEFSQILLANIARLRKMPDLAKKIEEYQPKPDPMQQQIQQMEIAKLQAEIQKLQSEAMENQAEAQLDMAKAGTEEARTANLASDTDKKNLDFVEQESGITHNRDVNRIKSQADSQAKMKVLESLLNNNQQNKQ